MLTAFTLLTLRAPLTPNAAYRVGVGKNLSTATLICALEANVTVRPGTQIRGWEFLGLAVAFTRRGVLLT